MVHARLVYRLYVSGKCSTQQAATQAIHEILKRYLKDNFEMAVLDVDEHPELARCDRVLVTPTLLEVSSEKPRRIVGCFSDEQRFLTQLGLAAALSLSPEQPVC